MFSSDSDSEMSFKIGRVKGTKMVLIFGPPCMSLRANII